MESSDALRWRLLGLLRAAAAAKDGDVIFDRLVHLQRQLNRILVLCVHIGVLVGSIFLEA